VGVSLNDETINLTKFQRAYQAAARLMTVLDENLDTLINGMGVVGR
jgi:flagellar hook-associated protein 1 FlgK